MTQSRDLLRTAWRVVGREMQRPATGGKQRSRAKPSPETCPRPAPGRTAAAGVGGRKKKEIAPAEPVAAATKEAEERHLPFPAATGNSAKNFFRGSPAPKVFSNQNLARDSPVESKARQGNGREAQKPPDRRLESADHCCNHNY